MNESINFGTLNDSAPLSNGRNGLLADDQRLSGIAVTGLGYWGPNWVRNLQQLGCARRVVACDVDPKRREHIQSLYPGVETTAGFDSVLEDPEIEGVIIATPVSTHYGMARKALEAGKSVLVEKPLATSQLQAADLIRIARDHGSVLMVGHTFVIVRRSEKFRK